MKSKRGHPRLDVIRTAFDRALAGEYAHEIDLTPLTGMTVDTVAIIIQMTETYRDRAEARARPYPAGPQVPDLEDSKEDSALRRLVRKACTFAEVEPHHRHGYEVVAMNYYKLIQIYQRENRKAKAA